MSKGKPLTARKEVKEYIDQKARQLNKNVQIHTQEMTRWRMEDSKDIQYAKMTTCVMQRIIGDMVMDCLQKTEEGRPDWSKYSRMYLVMDLKEFLDGKDLTLEEIAVLEQEAVEKQTKEQLQEALSMLSSNMGTEQQLLEAQKSGKLVEVLSALLGPKWHKNMEPFADHLVTELLEAIVKSRDSALPSVIGSIIIDHGIEISTDMPRMIEQLKLRMGSMWTDAVVEALPEHIEKSKKELQERLDDMFDKTEQALAKCPDLKPLANNVLKYKGTKEYKKTVRALTLLDEKIAEMEHNKAKAN